MVKQEAEKNPNNSFFDEIRLLKDVKVLKNSSRYLLIHTAFNFIENEKPIQVLEGFNVFKFKLRGVYYHFEENIRTGKISFIIF